jgi:hypothetical protein
MQVSEKWLFGCHGQSGRDHQFTWAGRRDEPDTYRGTRFEKGPGSVLRLFPLYTTNNSIPQGLLPKQGFLLRKCPDLSFLFFRRQVVHTCMHAGNRHPTGKGPSLHSMSACAILSCCRTRAMRLTYAPSTRHAVQRRLMISQSRHSQMPDLFHRRDENTAAVVLLLLLSQGATTQCVTIDRKVEAKPSNRDPSSFVLLVSSDKTTSFKNPSNL